LAVVLLLPLSSSAQPVYPPAGNPDASHVSSWQRLQQLSLRLESLAMRARDEAKIDARRHGSEELAEKMNDFAKDSHELRLLANERNVRASKINDQIRKLVDDAQKVHKESVNARRHDPQTDTDWNRTVEVLDQINNQYLAANGLLTPRGTAGTVPPGGFYRNGLETRRTMINDLDRRADDAARLSESATLEIAPEIERLRDQVRSYRQRMDELSPLDRRANIAHMLTDARAAQADLAGSNAPAQLRDDVNAIVGTLVQMRDMTAEGAEGTGGYGPPPGAVDRAYPYPMTAMADFAQDLDARAVRASELAVRADYDDVANDISHFRDKTRDFYDREASMTRAERREAIDSLLRDAQKTQRDLAGRHVSSDLTSQWNGIVDLLVRMRDRS
jgi:hypothetical protein